MSDTPAQNVQTSSAVPPVPADLPRTLGALRASGHVHRTVKDELRQNLLERMAGGGPAGATEVLPALLYNTAFRANRFGEAAAIGVLLLLIVLVFSVMYLRLTRVARADQLR